MWEYFTEHRTRRWLHILDDVTFNYNNIVNRGIKMRPEDVTEENADKVWMTLYGKMKRGEKPRFALGDAVQVEKYYSGTRFKKGYEKNFTNELFVIVGVYRGEPNMYSIQDIDTGEKIKGRFYERELSKATQSVSTRTQFAVQK